jgi:N-acetylmuramoyl-L-alanine amidase
MLINVNMETLVISSGHGKYVRGASGYLDEVDEARRVVAQVASNLRNLGAKVETFNDDVSKTQNDNLKRIVDFHNSKSRQLDVSVHFNAYTKTTKPMGTECLYVTQSALSKQVSAGIAGAGKLIDRGPKKRTDLYFLNNTAMPAILIEVCFVDSEADANSYRQYFAAICNSIASVLRNYGSSTTPPTPTPTPPSSSGPLLTLNGKASWFGGPNDTGVSSSEGLAFIYKVEDASQLFLPYQPSGTTGLARRLNPSVMYFAARFDYSVTPKEMLLVNRGLVRANGIELEAYPADWGPNENTGRVVDLSPYLMDSLKIKTDDVVEVIFPTPKKA